MRFNQDKMMRNVDVCADCGCPDPAWASINRGILICDDCCSIHRNLGRHVSMVKSLKRGTWSTALLAMIRELYASGSNELWEHSLLLENDPRSLKRVKPKSNDTPEVKYEFIQSKHKLLSFIPRVDLNDQQQAQQLSEELHSTVRTPAVKEALRLLVLGANPNWWHSTRNNKPLHIAAGSGQSSQVELLLIWGADPTSQDANGNTPVDYALASDHPDIAQRLIESAFEVTDRLTSHITNGRRPDHKSGKHLLVPETSEMLENQDLRQLYHAAQSKLRALTNKQLEELCKDTYDEVDRREIDAVFAVTSSNAGVGAGAKHCTPFLPVDPRFTSVRNQARQKLGRLSKREFYCLIVDLLSEIKRRDTSMTPTTLSSPQHSTSSSHSSSSASVKEDPSPTKSLDKCLSSQSSMGASSSSLFRRSRLREIDNSSVDDEAAAAGDFVDAASVNNKSLPPLPRDEKKESSPGNREILSFMQSMQKDIQELQSKVESLLEERKTPVMEAKKENLALKLDLEDVEKLPTQEQFNEKTVQITKEIGALKAALEDEDWVRYVERHARATAEAVNELVLQFAEVPVDLPSSFKSSLLLISSCAAKLIKHSRSLVESCKTPSPASPRSPSGNYGKVQTFPLPKQVAVETNPAELMELAYQLAKNLKQLHVNYAQITGSAKVSPASPLGRTSAV